MTSDTTLAMGGRKRYAILASGMLIQLCAGIIYLWSVFKNPVAVNLGGWDTTMVSSAMLVSFVGGILIGGTIMDRIGVRPTCVAGSLLMSMGILLSAFVNSDAPFLMYVTYSIMGGFGVGTIYTCTVSPIQKWFFDKRGFATGLMIFAFGFSLVVFAPLVRYLIDTQGVSNTFLILGGVFAIVCTVASLMMRNPPANYATSPNKTAVLSAQKQYTTREMLRRPSFYLIALSLFFVLSTYFMLNPYFLGLGEDRGLSSDLATAGVMVTGICSAAGRLGINWLSDKISRTTSVLLISAISAAGAVAAIFAHDLFFIVTIAAVSFAFGGIAGVSSTITADHFGTKNMGTNYGFVMLGYAASALVFMQLCKSLSDNGHGSFTAPLIIATAACIGSLICALLLRTQKKDQPTAQ
ncbi:MAG: OFA family MFS transporter [Candidatus Methanoplasma sp.]|jgi:OFA family oxalate/formate antiporter-like MFS transporter|nr:OFA family MFS transporter [Candidatus Methanoplasma sp.]